MQVVSKCEKESDSLHGLSSKACRSSDGGGHLKKEVYIARTEILTTADSGLKIILSLYCIKQNTSTV